MVLLKVKRCRYCTFLMLKLTAKRERQMRKARPLRLPVAPVRRVVRPHSAGQLLTHPPGYAEPASGFGLFASVRWRRSTPRLLRPFRPRRYHWPPLASAKASRLHRLLLPPSFTFCPGGSLSLLMQTGIPRKRLKGPQQSCLRPDFFRCDAEKISP